MATFKLIIDSEIVETFDHYPMAVQTADSHAAEHGFTRTVRVLDDQDTTLYQVSADNDNDDDEEDVLSDRETASDRATFHDLDR